jgi:uncharacterized protein (TIGR03083 family)
VTSPRFEVLPVGLRERVLDASRHARQTGTSIPDVAAISPTEGLRRAADAFYGLLCALTDDDWRTPVLRDLDVQGLVGHLIGVEDDMHRGLLGDPEVRDVDHVQSTQALAEQQAGRPAASTRADWRQAVDRTIALVETTCDLDADVAVHGMRLTVRALLVVRAFELWIHENDIRRATSRPSSVPDAPTLRLMTGLATELLPQAAVGAGQDQPHGPTDVRLVLTGPGGGTWDFTIGGEPADRGLRPVGTRDRLRVVTDTVGFCRLAGNRIAPADLGVFVTGDARVAAGVLAAVSSLALD